MPKRIISAVGSEHEVDAVLGFAAPIAQALDAELVVVHVARPFQPRFGPASAWGAALDASSEVADAVHLAVEVALAGSAVPWGFTVRAGDPATELLAAADALDALLVVVARTARRSGGTCEALMRRARRPVAVVPSSDVRGA